MVALIIVLSVLALIILILLVPVGIRVEYEDDVAVLVRYLFFTFRMIPAKEKKPKKNAKSKSNTTSEKSPSAIKRMIDENGLIDTLRRFRKLAGIALSKMKKLLSHVTVKPFCLSIRFCGEEPDQTAVNFGKLCAVLYPLLGIFETVMRVKKRDVMVQPSFMHSETKIMFNACLWISPIFVLPMIGIAFDYMKLFKAKETIPEKPGRQG